MGRIFLRHRYTKATCPDIVTDTVLKRFGGFQVFGRSKTIHSAAVWLNPKNEKLYSININDKAPKCSEDFWTLHFLRTYADCILTTGKILRDEPEAFHPHVPKMLGFPEDVYFGKRKHQKPGKPVAILTNSLKANFHENSINPLYMEKQYKKHILTKTKTFERFANYKGPRN